jgi:hypothetical protein
LSLIFAINFFDFFFDLAVLKNSILNRLKSMPNYFGSFFWFGHEIFIGPGELLGIKTARRV